MSDIIKQAKEDLENMDYGEVHLALEQLETKINRMNKLYPKWESIVNTMFMDAHIHGVNATKEDNEILKEFGKLMGEVGIKPITLEVDEK